MITVLTAIALVAQVQVTIDAKRLNPSHKMLVRFAIENASDARVDVPEPSDWTMGLEIRDAKDKVLKDFQDAPEKQRIALDSRAFIGRSVDISSAIAGKKFDEGVFKLTWRHAGTTSAQIEVLVVRDYTVKMSTNFGDISFEMYPDTAPKNVMHFIGLINEKYYDGKTFHVVIPGFMVQGGNPQPDGRGKHAKTVKGEFASTRKIARGTLGLLRNPRDPDSGASDFFIALGPLERFDGQFSILGQLIEGDPALREIEQVKTDHNPCAGCGKKLDPHVTDHCMQDHRDRPAIDVIIKTMTVVERKD